MQRHHKLTPANNATPSHCDAQVDEDLQHALIDCSYNSVAGQALLSTGQGYIPELTAASLLRLELPSLEADTELSIVTFVSAVMMELWNKRMSKSRIQLYDIRATLKARCLLLRKSRSQSKFEALTNMINSL